MGEGRARRTHRGVHHVYEKFNNLPEPPYAFGYVLLDGADTALGRLLQGHRPDRPACGSREAEDRHAGHRRRSRPNARARCSTSGSSSRRSRVYTPNPLSLRIALPAAADPRWMTAAAMTTPSHGRRRPGAGHTRLVMRATKADVMAGPSHAPCTTGANGAVCHRAERAGRHGKFTGALGGPSPHWRWRSTPSAATYPSSACGA